MSTEGDRSKTTGDGGAPGIAAEVASESRPIFAIFEGGGAKGIAHVGAYAAADEMGLEFVGVAGASAGSIVAALIAVGFSPTEIFNPDLQGEDIFSAHSLSPIGVLGAADWRLFQRLRRYWRRILTALLAMLAATWWFAIIGWPAATRVLALVSSLTAAAAFIQGRALLRKRGIFDPAHFADVFNRILQSRVKAIYGEAGKPTDRVPEKIRFRDIDPQQVSRFCRLKVVATDISGQQLRLFDHRTPDVVVAEAVAASIAIPGIFKPAGIPSYMDSGGQASAIRYYADGGLVSNLPVWCFSEEKAATERRTPNNAAVPIVAFTLNDASTAAQANATLSAFAYFLQVLRTGIFGGQTVVQEFVSDLYPIQLQSSLGVLAFDASWEDARKAHDEAKQKASTRLRQKLVIEPKEWISVLTTACADIRRTVEAHLKEAGQTASLHLRAAVFEPIRSPRGSAATFVTAYRVTHSFNMEGDADDRLTLDAECPGVPEAFEQRSLILWAPAEASLRKAVMTKYERAFVRRSVKSAICVPIFSDVGVWNLPPGSRNQPLAVVALDTDEDIIAYLQGAPSVLASVTEATFGLSSLMTERHLE
jgi:predicted acylesterase/phospholipase RssA